MAFLSKVHSLTSWHCKLRPNTEGIADEIEKRGETDGVGSRNCSSTLAGAQIEAEAAELKKKLKVWYSPQ
jgi:hypothetical protein